MSTVGPEFIDIGVNLAHASFDADRAEVLQRAAAVGVRRMIVTGSSVASSEQAVAMAREHAGVLFATSGMHPHHASDLDDAALAALAETARATEVVAVGECGLDYFRDFSPRVTQRRAFERQLELAVQLRKPVFLHERDAHDDFHAIVSQHRASLKGGVAHCFTGGQRELERYLALDLVIGITGWICDERRGAHLLELVKRIPAGRLVLETDAPYLLPRDLVPRPSSRRNEPAQLPHIAAVVARARGESLQDLASSTTRTARELFGLAE